MLQKVKYVAGRPVSVLCLLCPIWWPPAHVALNMRNTASATEELNFLFILF